MDENFWVSKFHAAVPHASMVVACKNTTSSIRIAQRLQETHFYNANHMTRFLTHRSGVLFFCYKECFDPKGIETLHECIRKTPMIPTLPTKQRPILQRLVDELSYQGDNSTIRVLRDCVLNNPKQKAPPQPRYRKPSPVRRIPTTFRGRSPSPPYQYTRHQHSGPPSSSGFTHSDKRRSPSRLSRHAPQKRGRSPSPTYHKRQRYSPASHNPRRGALHNRRR